MLLFAPFGTSRAMNQSGTVPTRVSDARRWRERRSASGIVRADCERAAFPRSVGSAQGLGDHVREVGRRDQVEWVGLPAEDHGAAAADVPGRVTARGWCP